MQNIALRGLPFERVSEFDFGTALLLEDDRREYGEIRYIAVGYLDRRLHVLCFVEVADGIRLISFRKANTREARKYGKSKAIN